jgi:chromosome segregation ATPase
MKMITVLLGVVGAFSLSSEAGVTPIQKVISLLQDIHAKGEADVKAEQVAFSTFKQWCTNTAATKQKSIKEAEELMEHLSAEIAKAEADVAQLSDEIAVLDNDVAGFKEEQKSATEIREKEKTDYHTDHTDFSESVDAVTRAINVLKKQSYDRTQASALIQTVVALPHISKSAEFALNAFLQTDTLQPTGLSVSAPEANAYEFQSGGVVDMLEKLKDQFQDERSQLEKEEMEKKHAYEMMMQDLTDEVERAEAEISRKKKTKASRMEDAAGAKGDLADTTASKEADTKYLEDTVAGCTQKSSDFADRQKLRAEELVAVEKAIEILGSDSVSGAGEKHLPSFGLLRSVQTVTGEQLVQQRVSQFLKDKADQLHSRTLSMLAVRVSEDPFGKVKKMIKGLIVRLMEEANQETEHKGWCDTELSVNKVTRDKKTESVNMLTSQSEQLTADIAKLKQEVADLSAEVLKSDETVAKATEIRVAEKAKNEATIKDAKEAQGAVAQALAVLKEFYAGAAEATALVQQPSAMDDAPETFTAPFKGQQAESGGVVGMLEVIASDFSRLESDTTAAEDAAASEYKSFMNDSEVDKAVKTTDMANKEKTITRKSGELVETKKDLKGTQGELDAALDYYDKLKPTCVDAGVSYEERVERREAEIQSLKEALKILSGEDI